MNWANQWKGSAWREMKPGFKERKLEEYCVGLAKMVLGAEARKMNGLGAAAWPDRLFILPWGRAVFVEFKREGEPLTPLQKNMQKTLRRLGHACEECRSVAEFRKIIAASLDA